MSIKHVIFDLDGVLLSSENFYYEDCRRLFQEHGFDLTAEEYAVTSGRHPGILEEFIHRKIPDIDVYAFHRKTGEKLRKAYDEHAIPPREGVYELLDFLDQREIAFSIGSSNDRENVIAALECLGITDRFSEIVTGNEVPKNKPAPDVFLECARRAGVAPENCLVIEDSAGGVEAAVSAGMRVIIIPDIAVPDEEHQKKAEAVVRKLTEIPEIMMNLME